jgi:hypothetical protein
MEQLVILFEINYSSTCFGRLYAHHQEVRLRFTAYGFLSCCSLPPDSPTSQHLQQDSKP